jgi:nitric oxide reductase NorQ protein
VPSRFQRIPCPLCPYQAFSDVDLDGHLSAVHGAGPSPAPVSPEPGSEPTPELVPAPALEPQLEAVVPGPDPEPEASAPALPVGLEIPELDPTFWVDDRHLRLLLAVSDITGQGEIVNVLLTGPKGTGKTSLPREFAATYQRPFFTVHCQLIGERDDWWGSKELSLERGTYFERAAFLDAVETPGCVVLLDEANRTHPENLNALFGFLDHRRRAYVPALKREVVVARGVAFFMTLNEGADYVATNPIDEALRDRMSFVLRMGYVPQDVETELLTRRTGLDEPTAERLVEFATTVRRNPRVAIPISTRQLLAASELIARRLPVPEAVLYSCINGLGEDVDRTALLQALQMLGSIDEDWVYGRN